MAAKALVFTFVIISTIHSGHCVYTCVCNYHIELSVFSDADVKASTIGYLYEFDCKELIKVTTLNSKWVTVAFEHQIGFIEKDAQVMIQKCPGTPPTDDTVSRATSTSTQLPTSTQPQKPTSDTTKVTTMDEMTTSGPTKTTSVIKSTHPDYSITLFTINNTTTQSSRTSFPVSLYISYHSTVPSLARSTPGSTSKTSSTPMSKSTTKQTIITIPTPTTVTPITLAKTSIKLTTPLLTTTSRTAELRTTMLPTSKGKDTITSTVSPTSRPTTMMATSTTARPLRSTTSTSTELSSSSTMISKSTTALHISTSSTIQTTVTNLVATSLKEAMETSKTTLHPFTLSIANINGNIRRCPDTILTIPGIVTQYGHSCYVFIPLKTLWSKAEDDCKAKGGHLFHITHAGEEEYIYQMLTVKYANFPKDEVWSGLNDRQVEDQHTWSSGDPVTYTNWLQNKSTSMSKYGADNDCVAFIPGIRRGGWLDKNCDNTYLPYICQYDIKGYAKPSLIG